MEDEDLELIRLLVEIKQLETLKRIEDQHTPPPKRRKLYATNAPES